MTGWAVFHKSISQLYYNFSDALKISGLLWLLAMVANAILFYALTGSADLQKGAATNSNASVAAIGAMAIKMVVLTWIAVSWHRYMLLGERPQGYLPKWPAGLIWPYILKTLLIGLLLVVAMVIPVAVVFALMTSGLLPQSMLPIILMVIVGTIAYYVSLRLSIVLPSVALKKPLSIGEAWRATDSAKAAVFSLAILILLSSLLSQLVGFLGLIHPIIMFAVSLVVSWVLVMISITVLTTLYGVLIEGRTLD